MIVIGFKDNNPLSLAVRSKLGCLYLPVGLRMISGGGLMSDTYFSIQSFRHPNFGQAVKLMGFLPLKSMMIIPDKSMKLEKATKEHTPPKTTARDCHGVIH